MTTEVTKYNVSGLKRFLEKDSRPVTMTEFQDFWKSLTDTEKQEFSASVTAQGF